MSKLFDTRPKLFDTHLKSILSPGSCILTSDSGFTLVEVLLSVALLGLLAAGMATPYISGLQSLDLQADRMLLDSRLRSRIEALISTDFGTLSNGSEVVTINGQNYTITWVVVNVDLDGDSTPEPNAKQISVSITELPNRSLTTLVVDHEGRVSGVL